MSHGSIIGLGTLSPTRAIRRFVSRHHAKYIPLRIVAQKEAADVGGPRWRHGVYLPTKLLRVPARHVEVSNRKVQPDCGALTALGWCRHYHRLHEFPWDLMNNKVKAMTAQDFMIGIAAQDVCAKNLAIEGSNSVEILRE